MGCLVLLVHLLLHFLGAMNVSKCTLFQILYNDNVPKNKFSAIEANVFDNIIPKNNCSENQCREIKKN